MHPTHSRRSLPQSSSPNELAVLLKNLNLFPRSHSPVRQAVTQINMAFFNNAQAPYVAGPNSASQPLQFFGGQPSSGPGYSAYDASGGMSGAGAYGSSSASGNMNMQSRMTLSEGRWWEAFGTGGFEGEPGLMEGKSSHVSERDKD